LPDDLVGYLITSLQIFIDALHKSGRVSARGRKPKLVGHVRGSCRSDLRCSISHTENKHLSYDDDPQLTRFVNS
jgi:hypothetical protein